MPRDKAALKAFPAALDAETRVHDDHHVSLRLWLRLLSCTNQIGSRVRQNLQSSFNTTLPRFDLMAQLERAPQGLKMSELSQRMMVTGGNVTGITDQLEKDGLVSRDTDPNDRRSISVCLTPTGRKAFDKMAVAHEQWVVELFGGLSLDEKSRTHQRLGKLKQHLLDSLKD